MVPSAFKHTLLSLPRTLPQLLRKLAPGMHGMSSTGHLNTQHFLAGHFSEHPNTKSTAMVERRFTAPPGLPAHERLRIARSFADRQRTGSPRMLWRCTCLHRNHRALPAAGQAALSSLAPQHFTPPLQRAFAWLSSQQSTRAFALNCIQEAPNVIAKRPTTAPPKLKKKANQPRRCGSA
jgi:hypothetical protein